MKQLFRTLMMALLFANTVTVHADNRDAPRGWDGNRHLDRSDSSGRYLRHDDDDEKGRGRNRGRDRDDEGKREGDDSGQRISLSEAVKMAKRQYGADVVRAETRSERGRTVYHLLLHSEGRVWTVRVDARTGEMY